MLGSLYSHDGSTELLLDHILAFESVIERLSRMVRSVSPASAPASAPAPSQLTSRKAL